MENDYWDLSKKQSVDQVLISKGLRPIYIEKLVAGVRVKTDFLKFGASRMRTWLNQNILEKTLKKFF